MGQCIMNNQIGGAQQMSHGGDVGGVAGHENQGGICAEESRDGVLKVAVNQLFARDQSAGSRTCAIAVDGGAGGGGDVGIVGHADVVVDAEIDQIATINPRDASLRATRVGPEIGIGTGDGFEKTFLPLELGVFGELANVVVFGRNFARGDDGARCAKKMRLNNRGQFPERLRLTD